MSMAFEDAYCAQKPLPKKEVMKLKPGTWIEVRWLPVLSLCNGTFKLRYDVLAEQVVKTAGKQDFPKTAFKD